MHSSAHLIAEMLKQHHPTDSSETLSLKRIHELLASAPDPFSRQHFVPGHLTASAIVMNRERDKTVLIFHARLQRWLQPGGHFEPGESDPSIAAAREVLEETGLESSWPGTAPVLLDVDVHDIPARKQEPTHCHFDLRMLVIANDTNLTAGEGTTDARWISRVEAAGMDLDPGLVRALRKVWPGDRFK